MKNYRDIKKSKLTLSIYPNTIKQLKEHAIQNNTTVSQMIEDYALALAKEDNKKKECN